MVPRKVRIFLASSAELVEHRDAFDLHVRQLNDRWIERGLHLQPVRWENFIDAMDARGLQSAYNDAAKEAEIFVMLYRTKVGRYTAQEFAAAFGQFKEAGRPRIYTYRHKVLVDPDDDDGIDSLRAFRKQLEELKHFPTGYDDIPELKLRFGEQLEKLYHAGAFGQPSPASAAPVGETAPTASITRYLERRAAHWRQGAAGQLDRRFVNLTLMIDHGLEHNGPRHEADGKFDLLSKLLADRRDVGAWVLVGLPGSGKSTVLQHHEMATADAALEALAQAPRNAKAGAHTQPKPEICIWHRLSEYDAAKSPPPAEWLELSKRWPSDLPPPDALRAVARVRFLLDGLNEIKATSRERQLEAVRSWTEWAAAEAARGDGLAPVFSVRTLDQSPMSTSGFEVRQVVLASWDNDQIKAYCDARLVDGNALWPTIEKDEALLELSRLPFNLWAQCALFAALGRPARDRAELMGGLFWQVLTKHANEGPLVVPGLVGKRTGQMIANGKWKSTPRVLPDDEGCLVPWLDDTMQRLHRQGRQVSVTKPELLCELPVRHGHATPDQWLAAVRSLQLIDEGGHDEFTAQPLLRCTHQLWQEFFAARGIRDWAAHEPQRLPDLIAPALPGLNETLERLGVQEPLPGPDPTHWEEPVKIAVQLVKDPAPWITVLEPRNLALAGRAAVACAERLDASVLDPLRQALLARSRNVHTDLRQRIEAGLVLGELGDPRYEQREGPHGPYLWPLRWVQVPAGRYRIGDDQSPYPDEKPETAVDLDAFAMSFAPVTNAEYRCFVAADGYLDERWWQGETARRWLKEGVRNEAEINFWKPQFAAVRKDVEAWIEGRPSLTESSREWWRQRAGESEAEHEELLESDYGARTHKQPQEWDNPRFNAPTQPVVGICQFEAMAYARWLEAQSGQPVRLPVEAEWEAAARGRERRRWPWVGPSPDTWRINADPAHLRRTSPVGVFASADSPDGLTDLAGNVWEWTSSLYTERLEAQALIGQAPDDLARRVVRGGSWVNSTENCRASYRYGSSPDNRLNDLGFRLVSSCPIQNPEP